MSADAGPIPSAVRGEIEARLAAIEREQDVRLLIAVESGSRAWGFPSPDSDYDVRFLYVRPLDWYLALDPRRDVIETPIVDEIDLNGWDIRKALALLLKGNAVLSEWLESPIRYRPDHPSTQALKALADAVLNPRGMAHHYASVGRNAAQRWLLGHGPVPVKKYFYALRPALAIRCLRRNATVRPPMNLDALIAASDVGPELEAQIAELVAAKRISNERGNVARLPDVDALILDELGRAADLPHVAPSPDGQHRANALFLEIVTV